jgi:hypothetical protein
MMPVADMGRPALRRRRGRPGSDDGLLEMLLKMALDKNLKEWPAAWEAARPLAKLTTTKQESLASGLTRKLRKIKKDYESGAVQDLLDDDIVYLVSIIAEDRGWLGTLTIKEKPGPFFIEISGLRHLVCGPDDPRERLSRDERIRLIVQKSPH